MLNQYKNNLFGDRGTDIQSALNYASRLLSAAADRATCFTALHVVLNTVINAVEAQSAAPDHPANLAVPADPRAMFLDWLNTEGRAMILEEIEDRLDTLREEIGDNIANQISEELENLDVTVSINR